MCCLSHNMLRDELKCFGRRWAGFREFHFIVKLQNFGYAHRRTKSDSSRNSSPSLATGKHLPRRPPHQGNSVVSFLMMQLLENLLRWITLHSHGRPLRLGLNVRFELRQRKDSD
jgi:hypothetical protein